MTFSAGATESGLTESSSSFSAASPVLLLGIAWVYPRETITLLDRGRVTLGRASDSTTPLVGKQVSRHHAELTKGRHGWVLKDLSSKNGVHLNGARITDAALSEQDVVRVGEWVGIVTRFTDIQLATDLILGKCGEDCWGAAGILAAYDLLRRAAVSNLSVCLIGETGSGKEVFARNLHRESAREGKLIATNCAAIPEHMADGELFGYRRGAFTGAERANPGHFRAAHGGTLFLDEVSDLPAQVQIKLLRAIEEKAVIPLGQSNPEPADARIVCAAQLALHEYVEGGSFRSDLYSRLNGVEICIPPLRMRREEILGHFMRHLQGTNGTVALAPDFVEQICLYDWPLNVREVVQVAERTKVLHGDVKELGIQHLPERIATFNRGERKRAVHPPVTAEPGVNAGGDHLSPRDRLARDLANALREARGNVSVAAKNLGVSRSMAYRLMKRLPSLDPEEIRVDKFRN